MVLSDVSIKRPVFATVVSAVLVIFGLFAYLGLPVREYPDVDPPILNITTIYRGASAEVIESQITQPIEETVAGIEGVKRVTSTSREESSSVSVEFNLNRPIDAAANDVRDRVGRIASNLPDAADTPRVVKTEADSRPILWLRLTSDRHSAIELSDYANRFLVDLFSVVPGVATTRVYGERKSAMRIWLYRQELAARNLTVQDVEAAIRRQNIELPSGRLESTRRELTVRTASALTTPEEFRNIVVKQGPGYLVRLGEVAKVEVAPDDERSEFRIDGQVSIGLGVIKQSKANTLAVAEGAREVVRKAQDTLPPGMQLGVRYDSSVFIRSSLDEVIRSLAISLALVVLVIFVFLRSAKATLVPAMAIPVSIIASFTVMAALGFSVNILTLLAMVLAIGIVVDDAIVVVENIHRHIEEGMPPLLAALKGARQIGFAIIATTLTLAAVFVPISFMEGATGRLFREFGVALAVSVLFSALVALTLTPMLCSKLLRSTNDEGFVYRITEPVFNGLNNAYRWLLNGALAMPIVIIALGLTSVGIAALIIPQLQREFAPTEDRGVIFIPVNTPEGSSLAYTRAQVIEIENRVKPYIERGDALAIQSLIAPNFGRPGLVNNAFMILQLKSWDERTTSQMTIQRELFPLLLALPGVRAFPLNPPSLGQAAFSKPVQFVIGGPSYEAIEEWAERIIVRARENPQLIDLDTDFDRTRPGLSVVIDRDRAATLGVSIDEIGRTLETMLGSRRVTTYEDRGSQFDVILQARLRDREIPRDISNIFVRANTGSMIPLSNLVKFREQASAKDLNRVDRFRSITVNAALAPGYALGDALDFLQRVAAEELPSEARVNYSGQSRTYKEASSSIYITLGLALAIVFLVLAAQFESFIHPLVIMLTVPLAFGGALGAIYLMGLSLNVYTMIGVVMLIGLIAKNGILIVEFANQLRDQGRAVNDAVLEASITRLRPILMTAISTICGAVPLAIAHGAGAEARQSLGVVIIGGMAFSTVLSLFLVPVAYTLVARFTRPIGHIARRLNAMEKEHATKDVRPTTVHAAAE
ncbi:MAG: efflux RND transporter permease subunit [Alphaproteobacteria bacterium]|nr:efflux RND transporter permease subunit [Alphaproteobacteria bacterium]